MAAVVARIRFNERQREKWNKRRGENETKLISFSLNCPFLLSILLKWKIMINVREDRLFILQFWKLLIIPLNYMTT
ncbi:hypothetical protein [Paenibacillus campinasensis]|uniref:hypothetical protein n=1 Tax=Paenibacillus campinasensis TaxID=66347 RepID=UPI00117EE1A3|nr:hypothetical protein [Paenibacillus campinasensis]